MSWHPDDPRLRRKAIPGETWHQRIIREAAERGPQPDWAEKLQRPRPWQQPDSPHYEAPMPAPAPESKAPVPQPSKIIGLPKKGRGKDYELAFAYYYKRLQGQYAGANGLPDGISVADEEEAKRDARRALEEERGVEIDVGSGTTKRKLVLAGLKPDSRKPGGRFRAGQRAPGRNPPAPGIPVSPAVIELVLGRAWRTPGGWINLYRQRALAALSVALALPRELSSMTKLCDMRPHDLMMLGLRMPPAGWKHVLEWLKLRQGMLGDCVAVNTSWLAIPPGTNGRPRMIGWAMQQTLHRARVPAWRPGQILRASWTPHVATVSRREVVLRRRA